MPKDRDIVDYLNLGVSLVQTAQFERIGEAQDANAQLNVERLKLEQLEAKAQTNEQRIRSFVFDSTKLVEGLEAKFADSNPVGTLILLYTLRRNIDRLGINTNAVRSYEDKERVHEFISNVTRVITACEDRLDAAGRETAATCSKYQAEESDLKALISYEERLSNIKGREAELGKMDAPRKDSERAISSVFGSNHGRNAAHVGRIRDGAILGSMGGKYSYRVLLYRCVHGSGCWKLGFVSEGQKCCTHSSGRTSC